MTGVLLRKRDEDTETDTQICYVTAEAEIRVLQQKSMNAKDCWQPPEARREAWNRFSLSAPKK